MSATFEAGEGLTYNFDMNIDLVKGAKKYPYLYASFLSFSRPNTMNHPHHFLYQLFLCDCLERTMGELQQKRHCSQQHPHTSNSELLTSPRLTAAYTGHYITAPPLTRCCQEQETKKERYKSCLQTTREMSFSPFVVFLQLHLVFCTSAWGFVVFCWFEVCDGFGFCWFVVCFFFPPCFLSYQLQNCLHGGIHKLYCSLGVSSV